MNGALTYVTTTSTANAATYIDDDATSGTFTIGFEHRCSIHLVRARSNQYQRTEQGRCRCGKRWRRVIRWMDRSISLWREVVDDE